VPIERIDATGARNEDDRAARAGITCDLFFRGAFAALQPARGGHRSGSDALLLAAALPEGANGELCELGAGAGVAAFAALTANPRLNAILVEIDDGMADLARKSLELPQNRHLLGRVGVVVGDAAGDARARRKCGLGENAFDFVIANPPYRHTAQRASPHEKRRLAHHTATAGLDPWMRNAAAILRPGGTLAIIWPSERLAEALRSIESRFGGVAITPLHARAAEPAARIVVTARRGSRAPLSLRPPIVLHQPDGKPTEIAEALLNGKQRIV
jgi:tRNA1(Val) A37 N6-methylase TrmN6